VEFSKGVYAQNLEDDDDLEANDLEMIAAAVKSLENHEAFNEFLALIYDFLASGNVDPLNPDYSADSEEEEDEEEDE
jgi:hypothetical protein